MQTEAATYLLYGTMICLVLVFAGQKLKILSVSWLYYSQKKTPPGAGISIVICARNEAVKLQENLPLVLDQAYQPYELIIVNDASEDATEQVIRSFQKDHPMIRYVHVPQKTGPGKKQALIEGIRHAGYDFILLTDADCRPVSRNWISSYAERIDQQTGIVAGYGKYKKTKGFLNLLVRFDTCMIGISYMNKALWGHPYMAVGRNMGYTSDLAPALETIDPSMASGDDDLFVQAAARRTRMIVNLEPGSFTESEAKTTWSSWLTQKGRHATTAPHYSLFHKLWLMSEWIVKAGFYTGLISLFFTNYYQQAWIFFFLHTCVILLGNSLWMRKMGEKDLILSLPFLDFIYTFVQPLFVIKSMGRKKDQWS